MIGYLFMHNYLAIFSKPVGDARNYSSLRTLSRIISGIFWLHVTVVSLS